MKKSFLFLLVLIFFSGFSFSAEVDLKKVEPPFWWTGMEDTHLQLLVYGENISSTRPEIDYPGVRLIKITQVENPNYLFLDLNIAPETQAGEFQINFMKDGRNLQQYDYELKQRRPGSAERIGFSNEDILYLLMPDRFANGNPDNDNAPDMLEKADRTNPDGRHGGDLQGLIENLDYLKGFGASAIWMTPFLENNMPQYSYHGYSTTDYYRTDPRIGTNELYKEYVEAAHQKGIKVIMDMVFNHCGSRHWWMDDMPMQDWLHHYPEIELTNFRTGTVIDPHASEYDREKTVDGWFVPTMPDLNQDNAFLANYLVQNSIWWIEYANLDGIRMDTYPYADKEFMADWMARINLEYPHFTVLGECWVEPVAMVAWWQDQSNIKNDYVSNLSTLFDFPMYFSIGRAFTEPNGWSTGIARLYETLGLDFLYADPDKLVTFGDNHDTDRILSRLNENVDDWKLAMAFLMTTRGIPLIYYGTEIGMTGLEHTGHGFIREDFPGGWEEDDRSAFDAEGRTAFENELFDYLSKLMNWRQHNTAAQNGKLTHFIPEDGIYVYFRENPECTVMVILNNSDMDRELETERFAEFLDHHESGTEIISGKKLNDLNDIKSKTKTAMIIELD